MHRLPWQCHELYELVDGVKLHYIVIVISNVLRENSAVDHQTMGTEIHKLIKQSHQ